MKKGVLIIPALLIWLPIIMVLSVIHFLLPQL